MKLKQLMTKEIIILCTIFLILVAGSSVWFVAAYSSLTKQIAEAEPTREAMNHMLIDVYEDTMFVLDFLNVKEYSIAIEVERERREADEKCVEVQNMIENMIITGKIKDMIVIEDYEKASQMHDEVNEKRDEIIALHKEELATGENLVIEKQNALTEHQSLLKNAVSYYQKNLDSLTQRNEALRAEQQKDIQIYFSLLLFLIFVFTIVFIVKFQRISKLIIQPLEQVANKMNKFRDGDYDSHITFKTNLDEMNEMKDNVNKVFEALKIVSQNPKEKSVISSTLLRKEYIDILDEISARNLAGKQVSMTDLKKRLNITHPTLLSRINYLYNKKYIAIQKDGREKFLTVLTQDYKKHQMS